MNDYDDMPSERWQRLALGQCSASEKAALRKVDPERFAIYNPLTAEERDRTWERVRDRLDLESRMKDTRARLRVAIAINVGIAAGRWIGWLSPFDGVRDASLISAGQVAMTLALSSLCMYALFRRFW
jgi:hypothetical protein